MTRNFNVTVRTEYAARSGTLGGAVKVALQGQAACLQGSRQLQLPKGLGRNILIGISASSSVKRPNP